MSNQIRTRDGGAFDFEDGLKVKGVALDGPQGTTTISHQPSPASPELVKLSDWMADTRAIISDIQINGVGGGEATTELKGKVQIATEAEAYAGVSTTKVITPATMRTVMDAVFSSSLSPPTAPTLTGANVVITGQGYALSMASAPTQSGAQISSFNVTVNGGSAISVPAVGGEAVYGWPSVGTIGSTVTFSVVAKDSNNKYSTASIKSITLSTVTINAPTITAPVNAATGVSIIPTLVTSTMSTTGGSDVHLNTDWIIKTALGTVVWQSMADSVNKTNVQVPANTLLNNTQYVLYVAHRGAGYGVSTQSSVTFTVRAPITVAPILTSANTTTIRSGTVSVSMSTTPTLPATSIVKYMVSVNGGTAVAVTAASNAGSYSFSTSATAAYGFEYVVTAYAIDNTGSATVAGSLTATVSRPATPTVLSPANLATGVSTRPLITIAPFSMIGGADTHASTSWRIEIVTTSGSGFETLTQYTRSDNDTTNKTAWSPVLPANTKFRVYVTLYGTITGSSNQIGYVFTTGASTVGPTLSGSQTSYIGQAYVLNFTATPTSPATSISTFKVSLNGAAPVTVNAVNNGGSYSLSAATTSGFTVSENVTFSVSYIDNTGVESSTTNKIISMVGSYVNAPTITTPINGLNGVGISTTLSTGAFSTTGGTDTHLNTDWVIRDATNTVTIWSSLSNATNQVSIVVPPGSLDYATQYTLNVIHRGVSYGSSAASISTFSTVARAGSPILVGSNSNEKGIAYTLSMSATPNSPDTSIVSFSITVDGGTPSILTAIGDSATYVVPASVSAAKVVGSDYTILVSATGNTGAVSSTAIKSIIVSAVAAPTIISPVNLATGVSQTLTIESSAFSVTGGTDTHSSTEWQIGTDTGFVGLVWTTTSTSNKTSSLPVTAGFLVPSTVYYLRVRYYGANYTAPSDWSPVVKITTIVLPGKVFASATKNHQYRCVEYGNSTYIVAGSATGLNAMTTGVLLSGPGNDIAISTSFTVRTVTGSGMIMCAVWTGSIFVIGGYNSSGISSEGSISTSPDGITWTKRTFPAGAVYSLEWDGSQIVAVGYSSAGTVANVCTSPDGITWTSRGKPGTGANGLATGITYSPTLDLFIVVGDDGAGGGYVSYSSDAISWTSWLSTPAPLSSACWSSTLSKFVIVGSGGSNITNAIYTSTNGKDWSSQTTFVGTKVGALRCVTWTGTQFAATALPATTSLLGQVCLSPDGITWQRSYAAGAGQVFNGINNDGSNMFVASGTSSTVSGTVSTTVHGLIFRSLPT
jgi:hypothetical protein